MQWRQQALGIGLVCVGMVLLLVVGTQLVDAAFDSAFIPDDPRYGDLPGTCYWAGDVRNYMRIGLDGYTGYTASLEPRHLYQLNDYSWWPLFPAITSVVIRQGGGMCSSRAVNSVMFVLLAPLFLALTGERRWWRMLVLGVVPFGAWLYVGEADSFFLLLSGALVGVIQLGTTLPPPAGESDESAPVPVARLRLAGIGALVAGIVVGLAKPNGLALLPAFGVWALVLAVQHWRAHPDLPRWRRLLDDHNPVWVPALGGIGIALSTAWWVYQTSGYYPFYVLMIQRALWYREFTAWDPASFGYTFHTAIYYARHDLGTMYELQRLTELAAMIYGLALAVAGLGPRWPGGERIPVPVHWRVGILGTYLLVVSSGQSHGVERYAVSNVFVVLVWYRLVFGAPGQSVEWRVWTFPGLVRWTWLALGPVLW
ncbi:MAG: hypothetical protein GYB65_20735, partial [Chloroflexi bacterium]|nr:hypothetical protein [Chloroflexota bacterium]